MKALSISGHNRSRGWKIDFHHEFLPEFQGLAEAVQDELLTCLIKLRHFGPQLGRPDVDTLKGSQFANMKELRFNADGGVWRIAFAFDPGRVAILLVGGSKSGIAEPRFYRGLIRVADERFQRHLEAIGKGR